MAGEYEEIVRKIPLPEQALGPLAGLATRLDYLGPKVQELGPEVAGLGEKVDKLEYAVRTLEFPEGVAMPGVKIEQMPFTYNVLATTGVILTEDAPFSGYIKQVSIHWPDGCNGLVDVKVLHGVKQFCPNDGYLALNDATPTYPFNEWVYDKEPIRVEIHNAGGLDHHITIVVILQGVE